LPQIRTKQRHHLVSPFSHFATLFFIDFYALRLGTEVHILFSSFTRLLPGSPTQIKNLRTGRSPLPHRIASAHSPPALKISHTLNPWRARNVSASGAGNELRLLRRPNQTGACRPGVGSSRSTFTPAEKRLLLSR
jgi:hypothetical protein